MIESGYGLVFSGVLSFRVTKSAEAKASVAEACKERSIARPHHSKFWRAYFIGLGDI